MNCPFSKNLSLDKNTSFVYYQDKKELYRILKNHTIRYKEKLLDDLKFGNEIEYVNVSMIDALKLHQKYPTWDYKEDDSLKISYPHNSGEFASPIFHNKKEEWQELKELCMDLKKLGGEANILCGSHVHVDIHSLHHDLDAWIKFYQLWAIYEPVLYRLMCNGSKIRPGVLEFAVPMQDVIIQTLNTLEEEFPTESDDVYEWDQVVESPLLFRLWGRMDTIFGYPFGVSLEHWLNLNCKDSFLRKNALPTIEFRVANGTLDPIVIQQNVYIISRLIQLSLLNDPMVLDCINRHQFDFYQGGMFARVDYYNEEHQELLFEFLDLICRNNEEKFDLAKQYAKKM